jgi:5'-nucleotidase
MATPARRFARLLLTNDDGIDAPGLRALEAVARELADDVWIVAPDHDQSGTSHSLSLHSPLRVAVKGERRFSVSGTPGDCVIMAVRHLMGEAKPDLILSGINRGANLGVETVFSGTVGAAMMGLLLGFPAMALSQAFSDRDAVRWETARALAPAVITRFAGGDWSRKAVLNINFPDRPAEEAGPVTITTQGAGRLGDVKVITGIDPRRIDYHWLSLQRAGRPDVADSESIAIDSGRIAVTPLQFERTHPEVLAALRTQ